MQFLRPAPKNQVTVSHTYLPVVMDRGAIKSALDEMFPARPDVPDAPEFVVEKTNGLQQRNHGLSVRLPTHPTKQAPPRFRKTSKKKTPLPPAYEYGP